MTRTVAARLGLVFSGACLGSCQAAYAQTRPDVASRDASAVAPNATAATCTSDSDCGWDDPCAPRACVAAHARDPHRHCGRPSTPGACRCIAGLCTTTRNEAQRESDPPVSCARSEDCGYDPARGACVPAAEDTVGHPIATGVGCTCDGRAHRCVQTWRGEVTCRSWRDCSLESSPGGGFHVAPTWFTPRYPDHPVRPCRDGSHDAVCRNGTCRIIGWRC
jgi:hypothetical protein